MNRVHQERGPGKVQAGTAFCCLGAARPAPCLSIADSYRTGRLHRTTAVPRRQAVARQGRGPGEGSKLARARGDCSPETLLGLGRLQTGCLSRNPSHLVCCASKLAAQCCFAWQFKASIIAFTACFLTPSRIGTQHLVVAFYWWLNRHTVVFKLSGFESPAPSDLS